jgi:mannose-6-phosphate isomerase-like protein (cupin superfamily)
MLIIDLKDREEFFSGDGAILREFLHPDKVELELGYSLARAVVEPGRSTLLHRLTVSEVYCVIEGKGLMEIEGEESPVGPDQVVYIPPGAAQRITNTGDSDLVFLCIVDPAWREEHEEVLEERAGD